MGIKLIDYQARYLDNVGGRKRLAQAGRPRVGGNQI